MSLNKEVFEQAYNDFMQSFRPNFTGKLSINEFMHTKGGALQKRYLEAINNMLSAGFDANKHSRVSPLIKNEKYFEDKPPRLVYSRDYKFNVAYAPYILAIEEALIKMPQCAKGCNYLQRGAKFARLTGRWFLENDFSKFESSQRPELFDLIQKRMFKELFPGDDFLQSLYEAKLHKSGYTQHGIFFSVFGCMASGDMETGCFNTIFNWISCRYFEIMNGLDQMGLFIVDGDDSVISIPRGLEAINSFSDFGFDAKLIVKHDYHDVEFCSSKFLQVDHGVYYQVQCLNKILKSVPFMINTAFNESLGDYYGSLGFMYMTLYSGIPVYEDFGRFLNTASPRPVSSKMLEKTSYGAYQAFLLGKCEFQVNKDLVMLEISMCFQRDYIELSNLVNWLNNSRLDIPVEYNQPYKSRDRKYRGEMPNYDDIFSVLLPVKPRLRPSIYRAHEVQFDDVYTGLEQKMQAMADQ
jgi:hypothetical protein